MSKKIYETVVGLEVHCELSTKTKLFCGCANEASAPNECVCPGCLAMPGTLPVMNRAAVEYAIRAGLAANCEIGDYNQWDRKSYFYPDLPHGYQVSQLDFPLCIGGFIEFEAEGQPCKIRLNRIHLEEDASKLVHSDDGSATYVDGNRGGRALIEVVSEPDIRSEKRAAAFLETLRALFTFIEVSECKMNEGSMRCDVNISVNEPGAPYGVRTELKNLASVKAVTRAIEYERERHISVLKSGGTLIQETRRWDDDKGKSFAMRSKETAADYRYFPDSTIPPVLVTREEVEQFRAAMPLLPAQLRANFTADYGLSAYDAELLTRDKITADFFLAAIKLYDNPKTVCNWMLGEIQRKRVSDGEETGFMITPAQLSEILRLQADGAVNQAGARTLLEEMWAAGAKGGAGSGETANQIIERLGLKTMSDDGELSRIVKEIIEANPRPVADYKSGNTKALAFFIGQVMKATKGKAAHEKVNELVIKLLNE